MDDARKLGEKRKLSRALLSADIVDALESVSRLETAVDAFAAAARVSGAPYGAAGKVALDAFLANCGKASPSGLAQFPVRSVALFMDQAFFGKQARSRQLHLAAHNAQKRHTSNRT